MQAIAEISKVYPYQNAHRYHVKCNGIQPRVYECPTHNGATKARGKLIRTLKDNDIKVVFL